MIDEAHLERRIQELGSGLFETASRHRTSFFSRDRWDAAVMDWCMKDPELKVQMFRFIDVLPVVKTPEDLVEHLQEYFATPGRTFPVLGQWGIGLASGSRFVAKAAAATVRGNAERMARRFIAGTNPPEALDVIRRLRKQKMAFTVDILGEATVSEAESDAYLKQYLDLIDALCAEAPSWPEVAEIDRAGGEAIPRVNVSVKLSAMFSQIDPLDPEDSVDGIANRLRPILRKARDGGAFVNFDMEHYEMKDITIEVFFRLLVEEEFREWRNVGIALQAYLRETRNDVDKVVSWAAERGTPVTVRLVRGAYWDGETVLAQQRHWPPPVFTEKHDTDISFESCVRRLLEASHTVGCAIASHNVRSLALTVALAEQLGVPEDGYEFQMLFGMGDPLKEAVVRQGRRLRIYTPYGQLIPGMAYLVRRLLENTANESFLRQGFAENVPVEELLRTPQETKRAAEAVRAAPEPAPSPAWLGDRAPFVNVPERDFAQAEQRSAFRNALRTVQSRLGDKYPLIIGGEAIATPKEIVSTNPSRPEEIVGRVGSATAEHAAQAVETAWRAFPRWRDTPPQRRAEILFRAAQILRDRRDQMASWQVIEVGKNWREADADVVEAIDYLEFYGREMLRLSGRKTTQQVPGETNESVYQPRGVAVVIPPWNFPLAIPIGMTGAALVAGNTVVLKPASQSPVIAAQMARIFEEAGCPPGVLNYLPGAGGEIGDVLVRHPHVHMIAFTGSRDVGCRIYRLAAEVVPGQTHLKRVIAEMGGKNALIVDGDADLDEAVSGALASAFGYQGQKCSACSRAIVLENLYETFVDRIVEAARSLRQGAADDPGNFMGPVIDAAARRKILDYIDLGKREAKLALETDVEGLGHGHYVGPTIFRDVDPRSRIAQEEIFGPVLSIIPARDLDRAIEIAMGVDYCLTGGLYSRSPAAIEKVKTELRVGNLYINRKITGAVVERQPFGGFRMSGIGSKAGGADYLLQFMEPRTITENTMRRGFAPDTAGA